MDSHPPFMFCLHLLSLWAPWVPLGFLCSGQRLRGLVRGRESPAVGRAERAAWQWGHHHL